MTTIHLKNNTKELLDTMFIKRFCLPCNTNIDSFIDSRNIPSSNIKDCLFDNFNHISCFLSRKFAWIEEG